VGGEGGGVILQKHWGKHLSELKLHADDKIFRFVMILKFLHKPGSTRIRGQRMLIFCNLLNDGDLQDVHGSKQPTLISL